MKDKLSPILCILLIAALVMSVSGLISANNKATAAAMQLQLLSERVQELEEENQTLRLQQSFQDVPRAPVEEAADCHCALMVESWSEESGNLSVSTFAQATLAPDAVYSAQLELWFGSDVIASQPISLTSGEAEGVFEADVSTSFQIPPINPGEELQLWLVVESVCCDTLFSCGATWYLENDQLMLITG